MMIIYSKRSLLNIFIDMSNYKIHDIQAVHNEKLAIDLSKSEFIDWSITCAFYSALHYVEAAFTHITEIVHTEDCYNKNRSSISEYYNGLSLHVFRDKLIGVHYKKIRSKYNQLKTASETARYLFTTNDKTAFDYFSKSLVQRLLQDLQEIKVELKKH